MISIALSAGGRSYLPSGIKSVCTAEISAGNVHRGRPQRNGTSRRNTMNTRRDPRKCWNPAWMKLKISALHMASTWRGDASMGKQITHPCVKGCADRCAGCHAGCEKYLAYEQRKQAEYAERSRKSDLGNYTKARSAMYREADRMRRSGRHHQKG